MAVRNLYRQARPFRYLGYLLLAAVVALLPASDVEAWARALVLGCCALGPVLVDLVVRRATRVSCDDLVRRIQRIENLLAPAVLAAGALPLPVLIAVVVCLAGANVSLAGGRGLRKAMLDFVLGFLLGLSLGGLIAWQVGDSIALWLDSAPSLRTWWLSILMITAFALALSDVGFRSAQRLDSHREQLQERTQLLGYFVPPGLPAGTQQLAMVAGLQARQWLTVCVVDLVAFTSASAGLAPETVAQVLDDLLDTVVDEANQSRGTLDKFTGDGALLFFASADRVCGVESAVAFANALLARLPALNGKWHSYGLLAPLAMRIGIAAGYCSLGQCGTRDVRAYTLVGPSVAMAERLQAASDPNTWLLCPVSARLLFDARAHIKTIGGAAPNAEMPIEFAVRLRNTRAGPALDLQQVTLELKGFSNVRVFRRSAKVASLGEPAASGVARPATHPD